MKNSFEGKIQERLQEYWDLCRNNFCIDLERILTKDQIHNPKRHLEDLYAMAKIVFNYENEIYDAFARRYDDFVISMERKDSGDTLYSYSLIDSDGEEHLIVSIEQSEDGQIIYSKNVRLPKLLVYVVYLQQYILDVNLALKIMKKEFLEEEQEMLLNHIQRKVGEVE